MQKIIMKIRRENLKMSKTFLAKIGASLLAIMLITACNNSEDKKTEEGTGTEEQQPSDDGAATDTEKSADEKPAE
jgi:hypothetical protein